ncbi:hypothetical protein, partial [Bacillus subtilis]|uniref:hypothetical protein n=1 Tax=Bacillus subtilis TaxID=1423 RepID=UPI001BDBA467
PTPHHHKTQQSKTPLSPASEFKSPNPNLPNKTHSPSPPISNLQLFSPPSSYPPNPKTLQNKSTPIVS